MVKVQLNGNANILATLGDFFSDEEITISLDGKWYFMFGKEVDIAVGKEEELQFGAPSVINLINNINLIGNFVFQKYIPITSENIYFDDRCVSFHSESIGFDYEINEDNKTHEKELFKQIRAKISKDTILLNILSLLYNYDSNWVNLYKILELIESANINVVKEKWISNFDYRLFKHTVNSPKAIGLESRHGKNKDDPPANPMSISLARQIIKTLIIKYIEK